MALLSQVGSFSSPASTGNASVNLDAGIWAGSSPKVVIIWHANTTADGFAQSAQLGFGVATAFNNTATVVVLSRDGTANAEADRRHDNTSAVVSLTTGPTVLERAGFAHFAANQFVLNWTTVSPLAYKYNYLCLGGSDLANAYVAQIKSPTSTGNTSYTGVGFTPTALVASSVGVVGPSNGPPKSITHVLMSVGVSDGTNDHCVFGFSDDSVGTSATRRIQEPALVSMVDESASGTTRAQKATVVSLDADGFTLNWTGTAVSAGNDSWVWVLCLNATQAAVVTGSQKTSPGNVSTELGLAGEAGILLTGMGVSSPNIENDMRCGIGALDSSGSQAFSAMVDENAQGTMDADRMQDSDECILMLDHNQNVLARATGGFNGNKLNLNWTVADATAREWGGLFVGLDAVETTDTRRRRHAERAGVL